MNYDVKPKVVKKTLIAISTYFGAYNHKSMIYL